MFSFFKKNNESEKSAAVNNLKAVVDGRAIPLEEVPDEIFSSKALGEGIAFDAAKPAVAAPCDCTVTAMSADMKHAVGLKLDNGMEILIHVGVDTVKLQGEGFQQLAKEGMRVREGEPLLEFDQEVIRRNGLCGWVIMLITEAGNADGFKMNYGEVKKGISIAVEW